MYLVMKLIYLLRIIIYMRTFYQSKARQITAKCPKFVFFNLRTVEFTLSGAVFPHVCQEKVASAPQ